jgi:endonuclease-3 related protein
MLSNVEKLYRTLYSYFGPQHWWPAETKYEVVVGAVLTQNTAWKNVEKAINNLKNANALEPAKILNMPHDRLVQLIKPAGFYNQKAIRLKAATKAFLEVNENWELEEMREHFLSVKGIGKETADSIVLYAFDKPIFVIDAYTRRLVKRFFSIEFKDYEDYRAFFESQLPKDTNIYQEYHALIVAWGKRFSKKHMHEDEILERFNKK